MKEYVRPCPGSSNDNKVDRLTNIPTKRPLARYIYVQNNAYPYEPEVAYKYLLYDGYKVTIGSEHLMNTLIAFKAQQDNDFRNLGKNDCHNNEGTYLDQLKR